MSRKSLARRTGNHRASAFVPDKRPERPDPLTAALQRRERDIEHAAILLGYDSGEQMRAERAERRREELRLPPDAGIDRSLSYLVTQLLRGRDGNHCYLCRQDMTGLRAVVEHIIPISRGGSNEPHNVALACPDCNTRKANNYVSIHITSGRPMYHPPR